jgi:drug/metabolite transporter (DMT)-like permease
MSTARTRTDWHGVAFVVTGMLLFATSDILAKGLSSSFHPLQIAWLRYVGAVSVLAAFVAREPRLLRTPNTGAQVLRGVSLFAATALLIGALKFMPVGEATMLVFMSPIFVTVLSVIAFGDAVSRLHWMALLIGLAGVITVIRPGYVEVTPTWLLPIMSSLFWSVGILCSRRMDVATSTTTTLIWSVGTGFVAATLMVLFVFTWPAASDLFAGALMSAAWTGGHLCIVLAYHRTPAWQLAPFAYTQIIWAIVLGYLVLAEMPGATALAGCGLILLSGVLTHASGRRTEAVRKGADPGCGPNARRL